MKRLLGSLALVVTISSASALTLDEAWEYDINDLATELIAAANERAFALLKDRVWTAGPGGTSNLVERYWVDPIDPVSYVVAWNGEWETSIVTNPLPGLDVATNVYPIFDYEQGEEPPGYIWGTAGWETGSKLISSKKSWTHQGWDYIQTGNPVLFKPVTNEFLGFTYAVTTDGQSVVPRNYPTEFLRLLQRLMGDEYFVRTDKNPTQFLRGDNVPLYAWTYDIATLSLLYWRPSETNYGATPEGPLNQYLPADYHEEWGHWDLRMKTTIDSSWKSQMSYKPRDIPAMSMADYLMSNGVGRTTTWTTGVWTLEFPHWTNAPGWRTGEYGIYLVTNFSDRIDEITTLYGITNFSWAQMRPTNYDQLWSTNAPPAIYTNLIPMYEVSFRLGTNWSTTNVTGGANVIYDHQQVLTDKRDAGQLPPPLSPYRRPLFLYTPEEIETERIVIHYWPSGTSTLATVVGPINYSLTSEILTNWTSGVYSMPVLTTLTNTINLLTIEPHAFHVVTDAGFRISSFSSTSVWQQVLSRKRGDDWPAFPLHARWTIYWLPLPDMIDAKSDLLYERWLPDWDREWMVTAWNQLESMKETRITSWGLPPGETNALIWFRSWSSARLPLHPEVTSVDTNIILRATWDRAKSDYATMTGITDQPEFRFTSRIEKTYIRDGVETPPNTYTAFNRLTGGAGIVDAFKSTNSAGSFTVLEVQYHTARNGWPEPQGFGNGGPAQSLQKNWYVVNPKPDGTYDRYDVDVHLYTLHIDETPIQVFTGVAEKGTDRISATWQVSPWAYIPDLAISYRHAEAPSLNRDFGQYFLNGSVRNVFLWSWNFDHPMLPEPLP